MIVFIVIAALRAVHDRAHLRVIVQPLKLINSLLLVLILHLHRLQQIVPATLLALHTCAQESPMLWGDLFASWCNTCLGLLEGIFGPRRALLCLQHEWPRLVVAERGHVVCGRLFKSTATEADA